MLQSVPWYQEDVLKALNTVHGSMVVAQWPLTRPSWTSVHSKDRLTNPLIRKNGKLERASWDEAMSLIVEKAKDVRKKMTSHGIGFYTSGQMFLEEYYALAMVGKAGLCTLHMFVTAIHCAKSVDS